MIHMTPNQSISQQFYDWDRKTIRSDQIGKFWSHFGFRRDEGGAKRPPGGRDSALRWASEASLLWRAKRATFRRGRRRRPPNRPSVFRREARAFGAPILIELNSTGEKRYIGSKHFRGGRTDDTQVIRSVDGYIGLRPFAIRPKWNQLASRN